MFDFFKGFGVTFSTMFKKVVTEEYPEDFPPAAPRYHGRHMLNRHPDGLEKCVGCELCAWACPADAIYVEGGDNTEEARFSPGERYGAIYQINYLRCIFCGLCIEACPTRSLTMSNDYELADDNRQDLIFTKEQLLAPLLPGMEQPPHPMRLGDDEKDYYVQGADAGAPVGRLGRRWGSRSDERRAATRPGGEPARRRRARRRRGGRLLDPRPGRAGRRARHGARPATPSTRRCAWSARCSASASSTWSRRRRSSALVQIIVYTGAIMMLFLFVLMLVGRDASDSVVEMLRGQRVAAILLGHRASPAAGRRRHRPGAHQDVAAGRPRAGATPERQRPRHRRAAVHQVPVRLRGHLGAADHRGGRARWCWRTSSASPAARRSQTERSQARFRAEHAADPLPGPGVFATANSVAVPGAAARRLDRARSRSPRSSTGPR